MLKSQGGFAAPNWLFLGLCFEWLFGCWVDITKTGFDPYPVRLNCLSLETQLDFVQCSLAWIKLQRLFESKLCNCYDHGLSKCWKDNYLSRSLDNILLGGQFNQHSMSKFFGQKFFEAFVSSFVIWQMVQNISVKYRTLFSIMHAEVVTFLSHLTEARIAQVNTKKSWCWNKLV